MVAEHDLDRTLHLAYWQRCLKTLLPTQYTANDSSRMTLGFFILSALDLLSAGAEGPALADGQARDIEAWVLRCQHPQGGFCGSLSHRYPDQYYMNVGRGIEVMDPANLPATFFALLNLAFVGSLRRVERRKCLRWLKRLQRHDGSFGEMVTPEGEVWGGRDMRYCYIAAAIWWILRGTEASPQESFDVEMLVSHIRSGQTYDGGISESSQHEAHAGYTYCAIAALSLLNRLPNSTGNPQTLMPGLTNPSETIRWLVSRQLYYEDGKDSKDEETKTKLEENTPSLANLNLEDRVTGSHFVGFNGRCNKDADTCYAFWVTASLDLLSEEKSCILDHVGARRFLLEQTQHKIGGFGKGPGDPPDIYHSYLGLAALATLKEPGIKPLDPALCISIEHRKRIMSMRDDLLVPVYSYQKHGYFFPIREDDPEFEAKTAPENQ